ncbi:MAG: hypothetical protein JRI96_18655 [Deltaproteobacteria bacterium]|nr:hypothetical protein [Deltaproteobacteria bacterium]
MNYLKELLIYLGKVFRLCWLFVLLKARDFSHYLLILWYDLKIRLGNNKKVSVREVSQKTKIHCLYFSCGKDFEYLFISLKSLERLGLNYIENVYLYIDRKDPLSNGQINKLKKELPLNIIIRKTKYKGSGAGLGLEAIISELVAFKEIITEISQDDYITKIDSDVLFISDKIFRGVISGNSDAIGQPTLKGGKRYMMGGCYFLRGSLLSSIVDQPVRNVIKLTHKALGHPISLSPEDKAISEIVEQSGAKINFTSKYFPTRGIHNNNPIDEYLQQYSVIHFTKWLGFEKKQMPEVWDRICSGN